MYGSKLAWKNVPARVPAWSAKATGATGVRMASRGEKCAVRGTSRGAGTKAKAVGATRSRSVGVIAISLEFSSPRDRDCE